MGKWVEFDTQFVRQRYNLLAALYPVFEWVFWLPRGIRAKAVSRLDLRPGDRVLEVGCGTGRNLALLVRAVGPEGRVYGVDLSEGMLAGARKLCSRRGWRKVTLIHRDASDYNLPEAVDGALFSLSYCTMPRRRDVLRHAWNQLHPGGHLLIMDAKRAPGLAGRVFTPVAAWASRLTVLGNPEVRPWEDLHELAGMTEMEEFSLGTYFICRATKPLGA